MKTKLMVIAAIAFVFGAIASESDDLREQIRKLREDLALNDGSQAGPKSVLTSVDALTRENWDSESAVCG